MSSGPKSARDTSPLSKSAQKSPDALKPLPRFLVAVVVTAIAASTAAVTFRFIQLAGPDARAQIEAIRLGLTTGVGLGGVFALALAIRRQRSTEFAASNADFDAGERRITELYTKAADQLGSDRAPVRLAGLYALERLGVSNSVHRQTVINLVCAYLRMPAPPEPDDDPETVSISARRAQEREVRLTAQRILEGHISKKLLSGADNDNFWPSLEVDLTTATLEDFSCVEGTLVRLRMSGAVLLGDTELGSLVVEQEADFSYLRCHGSIQLGLARFVGGCNFSRAVVEEFFFASGIQASGYANFSDFNVAKAAIFADARLAYGASFERAAFSGTADFSKIVEASWISFNDARFDGLVTFYGADFQHVPQFRDTTFAEVPYFFKAFLRESPYGNPNFYGFPGNIGVREENDTGVTVWEFDVPEGRSD